MKSSIHFLLCACIFFILTGCNRESYDEPEHTVSISFTVGSMLKLAATPAEEVVNEILLFAVSEQDAVVEKHTITSITTPTTLRISKKVKWFYAIANPTSAIKSATTTTVTQLMALTFDCNTKPQSPFLMSGKKEISGSGVNIELVRLVARIDVVCSDPKFSLTTLTVDTPRYGYVFARTPFAVPTPTTRVTYSYTNFNSPVYVAESSGTSNRTVFTVAGQYDGTAINPAHTFSLMNGASGINIERNTYYEVDISFQYN